MCFPGKVKQSRGRMTAADLTEPSDAVCVLQTWHKDVGALGKKEPRKKEKKKGRLADGAPTWPRTSQTGSWMAAGRRGPMIGCPQSAPGRLRLHMELSLA